MISCDEVLDLMDTLCKYFKLYYQNMKQQGEIVISRDDHFSKALFCLVYQIFMFGVKPVIKTKKLCQQLFESLSKISTRVDEKVKQAEMFRIYPQFEKTDFLQLIIKTYMFSGQIDELFQDVIIGLMNNIDFEVVYSFKDSFFAQEDILDELIEKVGIFSGVLVDTQETMPSLQSINFNYFNLKVLKKQKQKLGDDFMTRSCYDPNQLFGDIDPAFLQVDTMGNRSIDLNFDFNQLSSTNEVSQLTVSDCQLVKKIEVDSQMDKVHQFISETNDTPLSPEKLVQYKIDEAQKSLHILKTLSQTLDQKQQLVSSDSEQPENEIQPDKPCQISIISDSTLSSCSQEVVSSLVNQNFENTIFVKIKPVLDSIVDKHQLLLQSEPDFHVSKVLYAKLPLENKVVLFSKEDFRLQQTFTYKADETNLKDYNLDAQTYNFKSEFGSKRVPLILKYQGLLITCNNQFSSIDNRILDQQGECAVCGSNIMNDDVQVWESVYSGSVICNDCQQCLIKIPKFIISGSCFIDGSVMMKEQQLLIDCYDKPLFLDHYILVHMKNSNSLQLFLKMQHYRIKLLYLVFQMRKCKNCYICCSQSTIDFFNQLFDVEIQTNQGKPSRLSIPLYNILGNKREHLGLVDQAVVFKNERTGKFQILSTGYYSLKDIIDQQEVAVLIQNAINFLSTHIQQCKFCQLQYDICCCGLHYFGFEENAVICQNCGSIQCKQKCCQQAQDLYCYVCLQDI